nr:L1 [human papillomavirus 31]
MSLWRPS